MSEIMEAEVFDLGPSRRPHVGSLYRLSGDTWEDATV